VNLVASMVYSSVAWSGENLVVQTVYQTVIPKENSLAASSDEKLVENSGVWKVYR
jgi:beta-glucosidase-like glycosyl hydrolase